MNGKSNAFSCCKENNHQFAEEKIITQKRASTVWRTMGVIMWLFVQCTLTRPRSTCPNRLRSLATALVAYAACHQSPWYPFPTGHWTLHWKKRQEQDDLRFIPTSQSISLSIQQIIKCKNLWTTISLSLTNKTSTVNLPAVVSCTQTDKHMRCMRSDILPLSGSYLNALTHYINSVLRCQSSSECKEYQLSHIKKYSTNHAQSLKKAVYILM